MRVQILVLYKNFARIKCRDFDTELHFAGAKLREEKRKLSNQIKMTLSRLERQEVFWMSGKICTKVCNFLATFLKCNISWQNKNSRLSNFTNKEISVILRVKNFATLGQFHESHEILYLRNLISLTCYCQPNVQCALVHKDFNSQSCVKTICFALTFLLLEKLLTINKFKKSIPIFQLHFQLVVVSAIISLLHVV